MCYGTPPSADAPLPSHCRYANCVERSPSPEPYFDLAAAVARVSDPYRVTFFDLTPEIRTTIYRYAFKGHVIVIRGKDSFIKGWKKEKVTRYERTKDIGLNLMLVNKTCLAEVKAVALSMATYDINFTSMLKQGCSKYLRKQQGFSRVELSFLRTVVIHEMPRAVEGLANQLLSMPMLHDVTWEPPKTIDYHDANHYRPWDSPEDGTSFDWDAFVTRLLEVYATEWPATAVVKQHVEQSVTRVEKPGKFALKLQLYFDTRSFPYAVSQLFLRSSSKLTRILRCMLGDFINGTVHFVDNYTGDSETIFMPKRVKPRFGP